MHGQVFLVAALAALALLVIVLPIGALHIAPAHYLALHTLLEFISVLAGFLVFATVWHTPVKEVSASLLLIAVALFAAGWLDLAHALSILGLSDQMTEAAPAGTAAFSLAARAVVGLTLLGVSFRPHLAPPRPWARYAILAAFSIVNLMVFAAVIAMPATVHHRACRRQRVSSGAANGPSPYCWPWPPGATGASYAVRTAISSL